MPNLQEQVKRQCRNYRRGIFCPGEFWNIVTDLLEHEPVAERLDGLPQVLQDELIAIWHERPRSIYPENEPQEVRQALDAWCQQQAARTQ